MQIYWTPIQQVVEEAKDTYTFKLELPAGFTWEEGAHTHFALEGFNKEDRPNRTLIRHMSISTFRPLVLAYLANGEGVPHLHSLNVDSSKEYLFNDVFASTDAFTAEFVDSRPDYYQKVEALAADRNGLFYVVGSDDFLHATIAALRQSGVTPDQIMLDKHDFQFEDFLKA
ncbi:dihydropteridine reductase [Exiguobacterium mexicanum]|uniref:Dihydropteridine reductase n=1 Tax=Exiguobacterium mexicanum TaxID=340146 RepID=A0ABT7MMP2_9BACL|nr:MULTISPECIES: dihydropteridine reductase [Exiguobacterium]MDL5376462.1 dihydropteridine reductase [Exiguobacterium mexicanum]